MTWAAGGGGLGRTMWTPPLRVRVCSSAISAVRSRARAVALRGLDRARVRGGEEGFGGGGGEEGGAGGRGGADPARQVAGLGARGVADGGAVRLEAPGGGLALRRAQRGVLPPPAREGG